MSAFRKKPVVIEAVQFTREMVEAHVLDGAPLPAGVAMGRASYHRERRLVMSALFYINTLEGQMEVHEDDWIITGIAGEHYPCKPAIFEATYEPATDAPNGQPTPVSDHPQAISASSMDSAIEVKQP